MIIMFKKLKIEIVFYGSIAK